MARANRTRADAVRSRRSRPSRQDSRRTTRRRAGARSGLPPMVARRDKIGGATPARRKRRPRRRYDVALGVPGAEVHLPAIPSVHLGWRWVSGLLVALSLGLLYTVWNSPTYRVQSAHVVGIQRLNSHEVNTVLKVGGESIFQVAPSQLARSLQEAFPELYDIQVQARFPSEVLVTVKERQPVLTWHQDGLDVWIDEQGMAFPPRGEIELGVTVQATGFPNNAPKEADDTQPFLAPDLLAAILTINEAAPKDTPLLYDAEHGLGWQHPRGFPVYFGSRAQDMQARVQVYRALLKRLKQEGITPSLISVEHLHAPYYRLD